MSGGDLEQFSDSIDEVFTRLGLPDPVLMSQISDEWDELAGKPWTGHSKPLFVKGRTLVIEASSPSMIAFLRYGESSLLATLETRFGKGVVTQLQIVGPGRD